MESTSANVGPARARRLRVGLVAAIAAGAIALAAVVVTRTNGPVSVVESGAFLTTTSVTVPELLEPVDPSTLADGWYLVIEKAALTTEDALLLQAARELAVEARGIGYGEAKIVHNQGTRGRCDDTGCMTGVPAVGYDVLLKGPYSVPNWGDSKADLDAEYEWHQTTQERERGEATVRNLTTVPFLEKFNFG